MAADDINILMEMGFAKANAEKALQVTGNKGVEPAMEWLLAHSDSIPSENPEADSPQVETVSEDKGNGDLEEPASSAQAKSIKCEDCGKLFKSWLEVEYHATKSGHANFTESSEEKPPLTDEEKKEQLKKIEEIIKQKRLEREEVEKKEAQEREKLRIKSGKELAAAKKKIEDEEIKKIIEQRKREKIEEQLARQRVREQIEQDKLARKAKFGGNPQQPESPSPAPIQPVKSNDYCETRLQIRLTNGQTLTQTFGAKEQLSAVRLFIEMNRTDSHGPFCIMTNFPKKIFNEEDYEKPLDILGLVPSAVVIVSRVQ